MYHTAGSASGVGGVGVRGLGCVGDASVLGGIGAASALLGVVESSSLGLGGGGGVGVGGTVDDSWFKMRLRSTMNHALSFSSVLWSMSAPPMRNARLVFLFFAVTFVQSRSSLTVLFVINVDHRASAFSSRRAARA